MYNPKSTKADEFISDEEIKDTIAFAESNSQNVELIESIIEKARAAKGLNYKDAAVLLECSIPEINDKIFKLAKEIKEKFYGSRIVLFAPLYLSNYCVNGCVYCPYHAGNAGVRRRKLNQEEIKSEVTALLNLGHKRIALEAGEHPTINPIEYILESIKTIYSVKSGNSSIRRINVNVAATTVENYKKLKDAEIGTYILFQETYSREIYEKLHPSGPKSNYAYHTEAMDRAMDGGIDDVGIGVLFGLNTYKYDFVGLLMHAEHLEAAKGVGPHTISVPRIRPATGVSKEEFENAVPDALFEKIVAVLRIAVPYTGMIVSTRESEETRKHVLELGISQISGGSKTSVGGYAEEEDLSTAQFELADTRPLNEIIDWLISSDFIPSFCTACYREGRTGDRFMQLVKSGQIANCCQPNALMTLCEFLEDYGAEKTKKAGYSLIESEIAKIPNEKIRQKTTSCVNRIKSGGERDFRI